MSKEKKKVVAWVTFVRGSFVSLWMYLVGVFLAALFLVKGIVPENAMFPIVAVLCMIASFGGGMLAGGESPWGAFPAAVLNAVIFSGILILTGVACWREVTWNGHAGVMLICALAGGMVSGALAKPRGKKRKRGRTRATGK